MEGYIYITKEINSDGLEILHNGYPKLGVGRSINCDDRFTQHHNRGSKSTTGVEFINTFHVRNMELVESETHRLLSFQGFERIYRKSINMGDKTESSTEVFGGLNKNGIEISEGVISDIIKGLISNDEYVINFIDRNRHEIVLKPHQIEANTKINECFKYDDKKCLLAHKPRSGKTYTTLFNIKENNFKNTLILTSFPILNFQWAGVIENSKGFSNYKVIIGSGLSKVELDPIKNNIAILSFQDIKGGEIVFEKEKFDLIKDIKWDLLVIDEIHYGVETVKTEDLLSKVRYERLLGLSATPTKNLICGRFERSQIHSYTLVEETQLKKEYPELYNYADINFLLWNLSHEERSALKYFSDEEQFKFDKFFRVENGDFYYKNDIIFLFKKLIGDRDVCAQDKLGTSYPFKNSSTFSSVKSILLFVPNIESQKKLKDLLDDMRSYKTDFNIHITNSQEYSSKQLINKISGDFKSTSEKRSLIIAVDQLTTGITLEDCDMVILMNDWKSVDKYVQSSFRCQSPRTDKKVCFVVDINPSRSFELIWEYQNIISKNNNKSVTENLQEWIECVNIFNRVDGDLKLVDFDSFNQEYNKIILEKPRFNYNSVIYMDKLSNVSNILQAIGLKGGSSKTEENIDEDGIDSGKSKKGSEDGEGDNGDKKVEVSQEKLLEIAKALVDKTMLLGIFTKFKFDDIDSCFFELNKNQDNTKIFLETLLIGINDSSKIGLSVIKHIFDTIFNKEIINKKLYLFNNKMKFIYNIIRENPESISMLSDFVDLINSYLKPSTTEKQLHAEVMTPFEKINETLDMFDPSDWKNPNLTWFGPSAGLGNFQVVIVIRLMEGLKEWQPDPELRLKHILEKQIYICELQSKNIFLFLMIFDVDNKYKLNYYRGSFLTDDFNKHMKEVWKINKFDRCAENPPFNQMIDMDFLVKCDEICEQISFIHPSTWLLDEKNKQKKFIKTKEKVGNSLRKIVLFNGNKLFQIGLFVPCAITFFDKNKKEKEIECVDKINNVEITYDDIQSINKFSNLDIYPSLKTKIFQTSDRENLLSHKNLVKGNFYVNTAQIRGHVDLKSNTNMLLDDFYTLITKDTKVVNEKNKHMFFSFESEVEGINFIKYLKTNFCRFCLSIYKNNSQLDRGELSSIPWLDFKQEWTDEKLINEFKLDKKEVDFINRNIPKYYE